MFGLLLGQKPGQCDDVSLNLLARSRRTGHAVCAAGGHDCLASDYGEVRHCYQVLGVGKEKMSTCCLVRFPRTQADRVDMNMDEERKQESYRRKRKETAQVDPIAQLEPRDIPRTM